MKPSNAKPSPLATPAIPLRHDVPLNMSDEKRISVRFSFGWG
jgi:hypothetical protein